MLTCVLSIVLVQLHIGNANSWLVHEGIYIANMHVDIYINTHVGLVSCCHVIVCTHVQYVLSFVCLQSTWCLRLHVFVSFLSVCSYVLSSILAIERYLCSYWSIALSTTTLQDTRYTSLEKVVMVKLINIGQSEAWQIFWIVFKEIMRGGLMTNYSRNCRDLGNDPTKLLRTLC